MNKYDNNGILKMFIFENFQRNKHKNNTVYLF